MKYTQIKVDCDEYFNMNVVIKSTQNLLYYIEE